MNKLSIPEAMLDSHMAVLGISGAGKTYAAKGWVEWMITNGRRCCVLDPTGVWYGLRLHADGKQAAKLPNVVIFGGDYADIEITDKDGAKLAELIGTTTTNAVIDLQQMTVGQRTRFAAAFGETLMRKNKGPLQLVMDEAHLFAPQGRAQSPDAGKMINATNNMLSGGRARGLRVMLLTQRPQKLAKDSLTQALSMVAMQVVHKLDRDAFSAWVPDPAKGKDIAQRLATLATGTGYVWAPVQDYLELVRFPKIKTFDSSAADAGHTDIELPAIDVDQIKAALAPPQKPKPGKAESNPNKNGPKSKDAETIAAYREAVRELTDSITTLKQACKKLENHNKALEQTVRDLLAEADQAATRLSANSQRIAGALDKAAAKVLETNKAAVTAAGSIKLPRQRTPAAPPRHAAAKPASDVELSKGPAKILAVCIQFSDSGVTKAAINVLCGYRTRTRNDYISKLSQGGLIEIRGQLLYPTAAGFAAMPDAEPLPTGAALQQHWLGQLPQGEARILETLLDLGGEPMERSELDDLLEYAPRTRNDYLSKLKTKLLITTPGPGQVAASDLLFD